MKCRLGLQRAHPAEHPGAARPRPRADILRAVFGALFMTSSEPIDLLIEPRWLLPMAPLNAVLTSQAVAVRDGRIVALGPAAELRARFVPRARIVRERHALLPGLV